MSSIRTDLVALDTNIYIYGVRRTPGRTACAQILFEYLPDLRVYVPKEVISELHRNLLPEEQTAVYDAFDEALEVALDYEPPPQSLLAHYRSLGAKKGDAIIAAHLHGAGIRWLISENRHFLFEILNLPFTILRADDVIAMLE